MRDFPAGGDGLHVLLLGLDGVVWDKADGIAPQLQRLGAGGSFHRMTMEVPTLSGPGWSSILTGSSHAEHGVRDNSFTGHRLYHHPDLLARAFYADQRTRTFAAAGWPPLVDPAGIAPVIHERREQQFAGVHRVVVRDGETHGYVRVDKEICDLAVAGLRAPVTFDVGFVYLCDIDDTGHLYGTEGPEYAEAIRRVDAHVGRLVDIIRARAEAGEQWLVVVTTDHGHLLEGGHGGDSPLERAAFVIATGIGFDGVGWPGEIEPQSLAGLILKERAALRDGLSRAGSAG